MPALSDQSRALLWVITGTATAMLTLLGFWLEPNIVYLIRSRFESTWDRPAPKPTFAWFLFAFALLVSIGGASLASAAPNLLPPMSGDFRIAVAGFSTLGRSKGERLGWSVAENIRMHLQENFDQVSPPLEITIWGPAEVNLIEQRDDSQRANAAERLANQIQADLIIYGTVDTSDDPWRAAPEFFINDDNFYLAQEIIGQHSLGAPVPLPNEYNPVDRIQLGEQLSGRSQALAMIAVGLAYASARDYEEAMRFYQLAEVVPGWEEDQGKEVLFLLAGNAAGKTLQLDLAKEYFQTSLSLDPEYSRSLIGLGGITYLEAIEEFTETGVTADIDTVALEKSVGYYQQALEAANKPPLSDIETKVHFGLGQCSLIRSLSDPRIGYDQAVREFESVIEAFEKSGNLRMRELAAESHARLGLIHSLQGDNERSILEYGQAVDLLENDPERLEIYRAKIEELREMLPPQ